jgi:hypothetical protein
MKRTKLFVISIGSNKQALRKNTLQPRVLKGMPSNVQFRFVPPGVAGCTVMKQLPFL